MLVWLAAFWRGHLIRESSVGGGSRYRPYVDGEPHATMAHAPTVRYTPDAYLEAVEDARRMDALDREIAAYEAQGLSEDEIDRRLFGE
jgi:hypothetical protein